MISYSEETINNVLNLLDSVAVSGIKNCKAIGVIAQLLNSGEQIKDEVTEDE